MYRKFSAAKPSLLSIAAAVSAAIAAGGSSYAYAQEPQADDLAEVTVTGSRISRRDYEANAPLVTVDSAAFERQSGQNVESLLNQLPNYNPASTPTTTEDDIQPTAVNSVGIATISLRGFGPNRSLVLVDGKRPVPANALMVTDVNSVPAAMLERIEIISGGASAVYGADAIGGVTNFILRKNFKGVEFNTQYGITEAGDGEEFTVSGVFGTDFADGKGNITFALERYERKAALERNRSFYTDSWTDPNQLSDDLFLYGSSGYNSGADRVGNPATGTPNVPNEATIKALFPASPANTNQHTRGPTGHQYRFAPNGQIFAPLFGNNLSKYESTGGQYGLALAKVNNFDTTIPTLGVPIETLKYNDVEAYASAPQERYSFFTSADYKFNDKLAFFARANFAESKTHTLLYPTVPISGWEARVNFNPATDSPLNPAIDWKNPANVTAALANPAAYANPGFIPHGAAGAQHPVPNEVAIMLMSRPDPSGQWLTEMFAAEALGRRTTDNTNTYWQVEAGLDFAIPVKDWTGEFYWSHGQSQSYNLSNGNLSLQRWRAVVNSPDWGRDLTLRPNQASMGASNVSFGTVPTHCTSGLYESFFTGDVPPSQDCLDMVGAQLQGRSLNIQDVVELNLQGGLFNLPAGELRAALGGSWRDNSTKYTPDILESNVSFLDQVIGIYPSSYLDASQYVTDVYGELLVPLIKDIPLLQKVELELGFRSSQYESTESTTTYKALANIQVFDSLRLRGGFNRANRAPNLGELNLGLQQIYTGSAGIFGDACGLRSNASYGAGGAAPDPVLDTGEPQTQLAAGQTAAGAQSTYLICQAQMGATGAANYYSGNAGGNVADFGNAWRMQVGNPNLKSETADTWSAGFVLTGAGLSEADWIRGLTVSVDWWKVTINDAIQQYSPDYAGYLCYGTVIVTNATEAAAQANSPDCLKTPREPTRGTALSKLTAYDNQATIATSGIDVALNWSAAFEDIGLGFLPGRLGLNTQATFLDYYKTKASPLSIDVPVEWKGSLGPDLLGTNPGAYDYRLITSLSYTLDKLSVNLGWRYLPSVITAAKAYQNAIIANNTQIAAGGTGTLLSFIPSEEIKADDYSQFNLSAMYEINSTLSVRAGVDNIFNVEPSFTGATTGVTLAEYTHRCDGKVAGCQNPTGPSLARSGTGTGSKAFNDVLGRRFFVGLKARF